MSKSLAIRDMSFDVMVKLAKVFHASGRFSTENSVEQAIVKIQAGKELGLQPIQSMTNINVIQGKISLGAGLIGSLIKSSDKYDYRIVSCTNSGCELEFFQEGESVGTVSFTEEDAKLAGLLGKSNWRSYPEDMYFARALTRGQRRFCPDVTGGPVYTPEELETSDIKVEDDRKNRMTWAEFVSAIKDKVGSVDESSIKSLLKDGGFTWSGSDQKEMIEYLVENHKPEKVEEGEFEEVGE